MKSVAYWRFWQRGPGSIYWVFACAFSALVLLGGWAAIAGLLCWQWQETLQAEMRQNTNTALALKEHTLRILDTVDQAMLRLGRGVEAAGFDSREGCTHRQRNGHGAAYPDPALVRRQRRAVRWQQP